MKHIQNVEELRKALADGHRDYILVLNGGAYSRKTITELPHGRFRVKNHIDESVQRLSAKELDSKSNIGTGMKQGAFLCRDSP